VVHRSFMSMVFDTDCFILLPVCWLLGAVVVLVAMLWLHPVCWLLGNSYVAMVARW